MPNNYLSVLYKHIIQVENKRGVKSVCVGWVGWGGGTNIQLFPNPKKRGDTCPLAPPPPAYYYYYYYSKLVDIQQTFTIAE